MSICIPFIHSVKGYALYWDNYSPTTFLDNPQEMSFDSEVGDCADYYFIYGGNADGVIAGVRELTGQAPLYPLWTLGFWQCRERYKSPDELCEVVDKYRELKVPLDGIIQDWQYWGCNENWNSMKFQNPRYINKMGDPEYMKFLPNGEDRNANYGTPRIKSPKEMIDYVHKQNAHTMISVWASFGPWTEMYQKMDSLKALLHFETWPPKAGVKPYDPFNPTARDMYWAEMKKNIFDLGMDGWWLDSTEPDHLEIKDKDFDTPTYLGSLGTAISEAIELAQMTPNCKYTLGSVLSHVTLHQTIIGLEAEKQMEMAGEYPDIVIGCFGGGSNFGGISFPFMRHTIQEGKKTRFVAAEPASCPKLTRGKFQYDFGDEAGYTPLLPMFTLGHNFAPAHIHAGGLRYHGAGVIVSQLLKDNLMEAVDIQQLESFEAGCLFAQSEGIIPAPESSHAIAAAIREANKCKETGEEKVILFNLSGHGLIDMASYDKYLAGDLVNYALTDEDIQKNLDEIGSLA